MYAYVPAAKREDAKRAIEAAQAAFPGWAATPPGVKRKIFLKAADIMERRQDELVRAMMEEAVDLVHAHVQEAVSGCAELVTGGKYDNLIYHPTIVKDVRPDMRIFTDQTFGPVAPIVVVSDAEEALAVANNSKYGLSSGILTKDFTRALDIAMRLETGMVHIGDQTVNDEPQVPFGGVKGSGHGRFGGQAALDEFTELRRINVHRTPRTFP